MSQDVGEKIVYKTSLVLPSGYYIKVRWSSNWRKQSQKCLKVELFIKEFLLETLKTENPTIRRYTNGAKT